ncbi:hypothetical protein [Nesterenkonia sp. NBAIMH1]|uniref:hypothetical protein n=1 Tax=Nesterenkonia sp. NBAIMH1 TaxID=2600320 RepID=UPI0011B595E1|nr:hypothetical protein [Nesterenkonia sp. NBAIMH1]
MSALDSGSGLAAETLTGEAAADAGPEEAGAGPDEPQLSITGAQLSYEETAAVVSVIASLAGADSDENGDAGQTGPRDRRLQRRRSLTFSRIGLWGRPGPESWRSAGVPR